MGLSLQGARSDFVFGVRNVCLLDLRELQGRARIDLGFGVVFLGLAARVKHMFCWT